jgi:hypothetical protein
MNFARILLPVLAASAVVVPAAADAATFCVHPAGQACPAGSIDEKADLQEALNDASPSPADTIVIRKGVYPAPAGGFHALGATNNLTIKGEAGAILDGSSIDDDQAFTLDAGAATVRDLTVEGDQHHGVAIADGRLERVEAVTAGEGKAAVKTFGGTVSDVVSNATGKNGIALWASSNTVLVSRAELHGAATGISALGADLTVADSNLTGSVSAGGLSKVKLANTTIIALPGHPGLATFCGAGNPAITADHVTVRGATASANVYGVEALCSTEYDTKITVRNSILDTATPIHRVATKGTAVITLQRSAFPSGKAVDPTPAQHGSVTASDAVNGRPTYTSAGSWELAPASVGVDAADPNLAKLATDRDGRSRPADGNGDGVAAADLGALERPAPAKVVPPVVGGPGAGEPADPAEQPQVGSTTTPGPATTTPAPATATPRVAPATQPVDLAKALRSILAARKVGRTGARYTNLSGAKLTITWKVGKRVVARGTATGTGVRVKPKAKRLRKGAKVTVSGTLVKDGRTVTAKLTQRAR